MLSIDGQHGKVFRWIRRIRIIGTERTFTPCERCQRTLSWPNLGRTWTLACIPMRMGGFGLRDPILSSPAARLASLVNCRNKALELGSPELYIEQQTSIALRTYMSHMQTVEIPDLTPGRILQKQLTEPLHHRAIHVLSQSTDRHSKHRLHSLTTPHATAWTASSPLFSSLTPTEVRCALRWTMGIEQRFGPYTCPDCRRPADTMEYTQ